MPRRKTPEPLVARVGARIRLFREERSLTMEKAAAMCHMPNGHLSNVERGLASVTVPTLIKLAKGLEILPAYLLTFPEDEPRALLVERTRLMTEEDVSNFLKTLGVRFEGGGGPSGP